MRKQIEKFSTQHRGALRMLFFVSFDALFVFFSVFLAFFLRFEGIIPPSHIPNMFGIVVLALVFALPVFYLLKLYSFAWIYVSANELLSLIEATTISFLFIGISLFILKDHPQFAGFPRSTIIVSYFLIILFCGGIRLSKRLYLQAFKQASRKEKKRTLIIGAGEAGEQILRSILNTKKSPYFPIGFIDDNPSQKGILIHGKPVLGTIKDINDIVRFHKIEQVVVAMPSIGSEIVKKAVEATRTAGVREIKIVPPVEEIVAGQISLGTLREVEMEDLLGREPASLDKELISRSLKAKKVLITGGAGSIGSELCRQVARFQPSLLIVLDQDETGIFNIEAELRAKYPYLAFEFIVADVTDERKIEKVFEEFKPEIVFHAAAYKHVPLMEREPEQAVKNNVLGTKILAEASLKHKIERFVFISTDKAVNPSSVMGASKRIGEMICQAFNQKNSVKFMSVRFGNVLDSRGSVIPIFKEQIRKGGPITITHPNMNRYFMITSEACLLVMQAGAMGEGGEVFVLDMGKPVRIIDLARELIKLSGFEPDRDIPIVFTDPRPGEKFYEELLTSDEGSVATHNQKIFIARLEEINESELIKVLKILEDEAIVGNRERILKTLKDLISSYNG